MSSGSAPGTGPLRRRDVPGWAELWQAPVFCLGLAALVCVLLLRPTHGEQPGGLRAVYDQAQAALDLGDLAAARLALRAILDAPQQEQITPAEVQYLKGSLLLVEAGRQSPLPCDKPDAHAPYQAALRELKEIAAQAAKYVPPRLPYRIALAQLGSEPLKAANLDQVEQTLEANFADRPEGYRLLANLRPRLDPPDLVGAIRAADQLLLLPGISKPNLLRLKKADYLSQLRKWPDVTKAVSGIPADAGEYPQALQWRALAAYHQQQWGEAANLYEAVPARQMTPQSLLFSGLCYERLKRTTEAADAWEQVWREHVRTPEAARAKVCLAELAFEQSNWQESVRCLREMLTTRRAVDFTNPYLTAEELRKLILKVGSRLIHLARWDDLRQLAEAAQPWDLGGKAEAWLALAWQALAESGRSPLPAEQAYAQAADYAFRAASLARGQEKQALLHRAGRDALLAKAPQQAHRALGELLALPPDPPLRPLVLIDLAEALAEQNQVQSACDRLREAILLPGSHEAKARLRLVALLLADKRYAEARLELEPAAALVTRPGAGPEAMEAAHLWALFLYHEVVNQKTPQMLSAIAAGEKALAYAAQHPRAAQTRYLLGELLLGLAEPAAADETLIKLDRASLEQRASRLWQAYQYFQAAAEDLGKPEAVVNFPKADAIRNALIGQAECLYYLGFMRQEYTNDAVPKRDSCYQEAGTLFQNVAFRQERTADGLYCLRLLARCQKQRGLFTEARETLRDALQQLERMTDEQLAAPARAPVRDRKSWEQLLKSELDQVP